MENSADSLRKQLVFLAERRSMAEVEQILSRFVAQRLAGLADDACRRVILLLQQTDLDLLEWLSGQREPPEGIDREVLDWIAPYRIVAV
ncbi:MAG: succinate dehydrogenase assembly factor 2 [Magnetococcus sp. DMHC-8]